MTLDWQADADGVILLPRREKGGLWRGRQQPATIDELVRRDARLSLAVADLEAVAEERGEPLHRHEDAIRLTHRLVAALDAGTADALGLPPLVHLTLAVDAEGVPGRPGFRLVTEWRDRGRRVLPRRQGAILNTTEGPRRLPLWMMETIEAAEGLSSETGSEEDHWAALARFRGGLDPVLGPAGGQAARLAITDFLRGIEVRLADSFGIDPREGSDFDVLPFDRRRLGSQDADAIVDDEASELAGADLRAFQTAVRQRGALQAYRLQYGRYLAIEPGARPALEVMSEMHRADETVRRAFLENPRAAIGRRVEQKLRERRALAGLSDEGIAEAIERASSSLFVETRGYAERVLGVSVHVPPRLPYGAAPPTTWLPEAPDALVEAIASWTADTLRKAIAALARALDLGEAGVSFAGIDIPADRILLRALKERLRMLEAEEQTDGDPAGEPPSGPIVLTTLDNIDRLRWKPEWQRRPCPPGQEPVGLRSRLHPHQRDAFDWQVASWAAGSPGVLNADEQGLGKTLETLAFLRWLADRPCAAGRPAGPVLIVAPATLLDTWIGEARRHLSGFGADPIVKLYGADLDRIRLRGRGNETKDGVERLDLQPFFNAVDAGKGGKTWLLTTYDTLVGYQISLGRLPLSAVVFDEAQAIKNPGTLRHVAARALKADFRIALTGTPIENSTAELWSILDVIAPGALGPLKEFMDRFGTPEEGNMERLRQLLFEPQDGRPPLALRRLKEQVARDLPAKTRRLYPVSMPPPQASAYDAVRLELAGIRQRGQALRVLHRLRTVALHPDMEGDNLAREWFESSGRLTVAVRILERVRARGQRALIFVESRRMQRRLTGFLCHRFGLTQIDVLNGDTPVDRRRAIVARFQRHLERDEGFDVLILGPKAAGVGLTLTAATHVIHLSRWWNPAVEEQCNDRIHRIGQSRPVEIHLPIAVHPRMGPKSFDCQLQALMLRKWLLSRAVLWPMGDTEDDMRGLIHGVSGEGSAQVLSAEEAVIETLSGFQTRLSWRRDGESIVLS